MENIHKEIDKHLILGFSIFLFSQFTGKSMNNFSSSL